MNSTDLIVAIIIGIVAFVIGLAFGAMPGRTALMTDQQNRLQQWIGVGFIVVVFVLMYAHLDISSWTAILGALVGFAIAKIPPVRGLLLARFAILRPKTKTPGENRPAPTTPRKRQKSKKRRNTTKHHRK
ncbi:hypothetical protein [Bifidobacterium sp. ESL0704]|uniref:hypothetical protein n=1 Tax=Bifidobacterium sp. ESL0704 TaxID=2983219 RepID=UPI0023F68C9D|nr:hypothetical protein [Bifidobacterium sp. ESL0704]WEV52307.1 hypothetical protein OZX64_05215 [Bifidobacterium sp. ESL0704]